MKIVIGVVIAVVILLIICIRKFQRHEFCRPRKKQRNSGKTMTSSEKYGNRKEGCPRLYTFYDGPPTANGKPHIGHVLTRVIKDMIPRYRTMKGYMVPRKAGWDTHGLPVELEVEKAAWS